MQFFLVYCREAHPIDGSRPGPKEVEDPVSDEERREVAQHFVAEMKMPLPALLDGVDDAVGKAYASHPDRLYLIGKDGRIAYAGDRGPRGFKPRELEEAIEDELFRIANEPKKQKKSKPQKPAGKEAAQKKEKAPQKR